MNVSNMTGQPTTRPKIRVGDQVLGGRQLFLLAGPCVLERRDLAFEIAERVAKIASDRDMPFVFKASFDKANRSSIRSDRGVGIEQGLEWLGELRSKLKLPVVTDVHLPDQCARAAEVADVLQIPAFLCRQTDLIAAAAATGRAVNIKKGQFLAPWDMKHVARKATEAGCENLMLTERGTSFGYGRLIVDMNGLGYLAQLGHPVVFDATHSVQEPGALGETTGGDRTKVPALARAAVATGNVDGLFFEVHPDPDSSPSDGPNMVLLDDFEEVLDGVLRVHAAVTRD